MALPDKHQLKFNIHKDAKSLMEAIKKRFGGNKETNKVQKSLLKQQYENFSDTSSESLDQIHDRLQKLISQLEILGETIALEDINLKFLRSLPSELKTHTLIWRNKADLDEQSLDDFSVVPSISTASSKTPVSTLPNVDSLSDAIIYSFFVSQSNSPQLENDDLKQIDADYLEEMDLKWQMAMLTMRARRFLQKTRRNLGANGITTIRFDMSKVECYHCHRRCHFARECRLPRENRNKDTPRRTIPVEVSTSNALVSHCDTVGNYDWSFHPDKEPTNYALIAYASSGSSSSSRSDNEVAPFSKACSQAYTTLQTHYDKLNVDFRKSQFDVLSYKTGLESVKARLVVYQKNETSSKNLSKLLESQVNDKTSLGYDSQVFNSQVFDCDELNSSESADSVPTSPVNDRYKTGEGYHAVSPPYTGTFMPLKPDLVFNVAPNANETEIESMPKQKEPSFVQTSEHVKTPRPVPIVVPQTIVKSPRPVKHVVNKAHSPIRRPINHRQSTKHSNFHKKVTTIKVNKVNVVQGVKGNADKASANWVWKPKCKVIDHVSRLISALMTFKKFDYTDALGRSKVPIENNMYNVDLKNVVPSGDLTCLFEKATFDESNLWHRRLGHINFKTMNKLVKGNLVRGLPSKIFENNHTCVACKKGKQHKASWIKREFSIARTPQQNIIAEGKNKTLIEAAMTMLADSLLPIPFWDEAVNTICYVQNRVLVTKPHNKTPYELLLGRTPSIGFIRPFGCLVTILNTLDPLGKFDGKADEGFLVGYSVNSKAFRVFNRSGPTWLFDIDTLTHSMNYQPVVAGNQPNHNADPQNTYDDAAFDVKENENEVHVSPSVSDKTKKHNEKAKRDDKGKSHVDSPTGVRDLRAEFEEFSSNSTNRVNAASAPVTAARPNPTNSTNGFNTASPSDTVVSPNLEIDRKSSFVDLFNYPDDPDMLALEDIFYSDYEEDVGAEADLSNLETTIFVSPISTTKVHKDHPVTQIISDLTLAPQTRSMARMVKEQGGLNQINDEDFHTYLPKGKRAIGSKWVFRNKKDERGIVIRNKARLVAQGHTQEKGIDYDEVFAPVARIEALWLFLAYASFMGFMIYQMDVKSAFLYGTIKEKVYVFQPPGFKDHDYPDRVYKVVKALYGLHQAPRAWYETLASYLLENSFQRGKIDQALFIKKQKGDIFLVQVYVDDIIFGSTNKEPCKAFKKLMKDKFQMSFMGELTFFLGLQVKQKDDGIFISQDIYVVEILRKFGFTDVKSANTPIETKKPLLKDPDGEDVETVVTTSSTKAEYVADVLSEELASPKQTALGKDKSNPFMACSLPKTKWNNQLTPLNLLNTLMETCATFSQKVAELEQDKQTQALEILKLKKRVKKLKKKKKKTRSSGLKRLRIHSKGSRTYWKIIRVRGITEAYQSFKYMLKIFDREDLVELKRLFEPDVDDVLWKLQREELSLVKWSYDPDAECKVASLRRYSLSSFITIAKGGSSFIFTFFNLPARAEIVLEAKELLLTLAGAEEGSFIMIPFKVSSLNVDFDFKIDLIVFGPETSLAPVSFSNKGRGCYRLKIHPLNHNQVESLAFDNLGLLLPVIETSELYAEDLTDTGSFSPELEGLKSLQYDVSNGFDTVYQDFLGVGTTFDIFQNIHLLYLQYGVLDFSGYGVLIMFPSWSLVSAGTDASYLP
nr:hypothetical protein [Tanacetum cinerariifolium]